MRAPGGRRCAVQQCHRDLGEASERAPSVWRGGRAGPHAVRGAAVGHEPQCLVLPDSAVFARRSASSDLWLPSLCRPAAGIAKQASLARTRTDLRRKPGGKTVAD